MIRKTVATKVAVVFVAASIGLGGSVMGAFAKGHESSRTASETTVLSPDVQAQIAALEVTLAKAKADLKVAEAALDRLDEHDETPANATAAALLEAEITRLETLIADLKAQIAALEATADGANNDDKKDSEDKKDVEKAEVENEDVEKAEGVEKSD